MCVFSAFVSCLAFLVLCSNQRIQRGSAVSGAPFPDEVFKSEKFLVGNVSLPVILFASHGD